MKTLSEEQMLKAWRLWCLNMDTLAITRILVRDDRGVTEAAVYNSLHKARDLIRAQRVA